MAMIWPAPAPEDGESPDSESPEATAAGDRPVGVPFASFGLPSGRRPIPLILGGGCAQPPIWPAGAANAALPTANAPMIVRAVPDTSAPMRLCQLTLRSPSRIARHVMEPYESSGFRTAYVKRSRANTTHRLGEAERLCGRVAILNTTPAHHRPARRAPRPAVRQDTHGHDPQPALRPGPRLRRLPAVDSWHPDGPATYV